MNMTYEIRQSGESRSFPTGDAFLDGGEAGADVVILLGKELQADPSRAAILVELGHESLGVHTGEDAGREGSNVLGFARFRNGDDAPSNLIELVRQPATPDSTIDAARAVFEGAGLEVAVCTDQAGRILDRLIRPKYNAALRFLDEGLATAAFLAAQAQVPAIAARGGGAIVFTSSFVGFSNAGLPGMGAYAASKAGINGLVQSLAADHAAQGVRVHSLMPGGTLTALAGDDPAVQASIAALHPMKRLAQPEEIAQAALFLLSDRAGFMTGSPVLVDGGMSVRLL